VPSSANTRLSLAREAMPSRLHPGTAMGRDELAGLVREWITANDPQGRLSAFDSNHLGKLERGLVVLTREVGDAAGGWLAGECGVAAVVIVGVQPAR
jgi:hypothetical protein